jgi:hypothetical protein
LSHIEEEVKQQLFKYINNPEDCFWSKLTTPKDLKEMFYFPSGNIDQTMLTDKQMYFDRTFSCGSIAGTPGYMCSQQIIRKHTNSS